MKDVRKLATAFCAALVLVGCSWISNPASKSQVTPHWETKRRIVLCYMGNFSQGDFAVKDIGAPTAETWRGKLDSGRSCGEFLSKYLQPDQQLRTPTEVIGKDVRGLGTGTVLVVMRNARGEDRILLRSDDLRESLKEVERQGVK